MYHTIIIIGNLGKDPELSYTAAGQPVTKLSVATNRKYTDGFGQPVKETCWFHVSVWGKQAEACQANLAKGGKVLIEGRLTPDPKTGNPRIWKSKGQVNSQYEVTAAVVRFLSGNEPRTKNVDHSEEDAQEQGEINLDEIPF